MASANFPTWTPIITGCRVNSSNEVLFETKRTHPCSRVFRSMDYDMPHCVENCSRGCHENRDCRNNLIDIRSPSRRKRSPGWLSCSTWNTGSREEIRIRETNNRKILTLGIFESSCKAVRNWTRVRYECCWREWNFGRKF